MGRAALIGGACGAVLGVVLVRAGGYGTSVVALEAMLGALEGVLIATFVALRRAGGRLRSPAPDLWDHWLDDQNGEPEGLSDADGGIDEAEPSLGRARARVRPRVVTREGGDALPLEDEIWPLVQSGECGAVRITGPEGSGKTTALRHLANHFPPRAPVLLLDGPEPGAVAEGAREGLVIYAGGDGSCPKHLATYRLAPWGTDELIEYLLPEGAECCASVMGRLKRADPDRGLLAGNPELWRVVLERMIADGSVQSIRAAIRIGLNTRLVDPEARVTVRSACLAALIAGDAGKDLQGDFLKRRCPGEGVYRLVRHRVVQLLLAAERVASGLGSGEACEYLTEKFPRDLVREAAHLIVGDPAALERLQQLIAETDARRHPTVASLLHATGTGWRPGGPPAPRLSGAYLERACWSGVVLTGAEMEGVDLRGVDLSGAKLDGAILGRAHLSAARLRRASFVGGIAVEADLRRADLGSIRAARGDFRAANLEAADLVRASLTDALLAGSVLTSARLAFADLSGADLEGANLDDADFTGANLSRANLKRLKLTRADFSGARFPGAKLAGCDLETMELPSADFSGADLTGALLTASSMPGADFRNACLREAGLADVEWEGVRLDGADLRGASFHAGSSRSGRVGSPIACEGSRTGFYTDDYGDQDFKSPEEIRKANLCGADLRGAALGGIDFYLVDLRGAHYDHDQAVHFRRCGAILQSRA
jgi:uncharacterized protein YjbI with pentapeptide repeats